MTDATTAEPLPDLSQCDREPIRVPGSLQPHGLLFALTADAARVAQTGANSEHWIGLPAAEVAGRPLAELIGAADADAVARHFADPAADDTPIYLRTAVAGGRPFRLVAHRHDGVALLELEPADDTEPIGFSALYPVVRSFVTSLESADSVDEVCRLAADEVRRLTGFDRVMVYRFDPDWNGEVIAESRGGRFESFLGLHFPASDIPAQARELYRANRYRVIPDAGYAPVPLVPERHPETGRPLDLSQASLRSVSPVHCEYLHNMGVTASLSVSVVLGGELWALIACHHPEPRAVPFEVRTALDLLAQLLAQQVSAHEKSSDIRRRIGLKGAESRLLAAMAAECHFVDGLVASTPEALAFAGATGAAVLYEGECTRIGDTPGEEALRELAGRLTAEGVETVYHSDVRERWWPEAPAGAPAGVLAARISRLHPSYLFWFRPEVVRTVTWAGNPAKLPVGASGRIHPRASFDQWKETVAGRSLPWDAPTLAAALDLRNAVVGIVLRKAEEQAALSAELTRSNKELEAFSYSVSHDLRAPFRHIVGYAQLLAERSAAKLDETDRRYLDTISESAVFAGKLVDGLLSFSQMGRSALTPTRVDLNHLVRDVVRMLAPPGGGPVNWEIGSLPTVRADAMMMRVVFQNLIANALKFSARREVPRVEIACVERESDYTIAVRDNGVGFDMRYAQKLFGVFQRLHRSEDFEGTGIGLANVQRAVARHGGRVWAEGRPGEGAAFFVALPKG